MFCCRLACHDTLEVPQYHSLLFIWNMFCCRLACHDTLEVPQYHRGGAGVVYLLFIWNMFCCRLDCHDTLEVPQYHRGGRGVVTLPPSRGGGVPWTSNSAPYMYNLNPPNKKNNTTFKNLNPSPPKKTRKTHFSDHLKANPKGTISTNPHTETNPETRPSVLCPRLGPLLCLRGLRAPRSLPRSLPQRFAQAQLYPSEPKPPPQEEVEEVEHFAPQEPAERSGAL